MIIIGVDYHPSDQYLAFVDTETGEYGERRLNHREGEAEKFYRELAERRVRVRVGMEATGYSRWFERLFLPAWAKDKADWAPFVTIIGLTSRDRLRFACY